MKEKLKSIVRAIWRSAPYRGVLFGLDRLAFMTAKPAVRSQPYSLLLSPPTGKNLGDQAMFDSAIHNTPGAVVAVITADDYRLPVGPDGERTETVILRGIIHKPPFVRFAVIRRYASLVKGASLLIAPGADTVDGAHTQGSLARLSLLRMGALAGIPTVLQGFSWKANAPKTVVTVMKGLADAGVEIRPRDPLSRRRLTELGVTPTVQAADLAFSYTARDELYPELQSFLDKAKADGVPVALLNTSGLIERRADLLADYVLVLERLHTAGVRVIFTPHVDRRHDDDFAMARKVHAAAGNADDFVIDRLLTPAQVRQLAASAYLTITGRMHLGILSLTQSVPVVCLATHGKVEGLFEIFGLLDLVVEPAPGCGPKIVTALEIVLADRDGVSQQITDALPKARELSAQNFPYRDEKPATA